MKKNCIFLIILISVLNLSALTVTVADIDNYPLKLQFNLESGVGIEGKSNSKTGKTDYNTIFFKPAFHIDKFGIGFNLKLRFSRYPELLEFNRRDWDFSNGFKSGFITFINKLDYIRFADTNYPFYFTTGEIPVFRAGQGLLINSIDNTAFNPIFKEHGLYSKFNGNLLKRTIPLEFYFFMPDIADPDIIIAGGDFNFSHFIKKDFLYMSGGLYTAVDLDSTESNFYSALEFKEIETFRNSSFQDHTIGFTSPFETRFRFEHAQVRALSESSFIYKNKNNSADFAQYIGIRGDFINLNNRGFLIGIPFGITVKSKGFYNGYFSYNYYMERKRQFEKEDKFGNLFFNYGIFLTAFDENILFFVNIISPFEMEYYTASYEAGFTFNGTKSGLMNGLQIDVRYKTGMQTLNINGDGGYFLYSITNNFRFTAEFAFNIYSSKVSFLAGVQRPEWVRTLFNEYRKDYTIKDDNDVEKIYSTVIDTDRYGKMLESFMKLEVSFAF